MPRPTSTDQSISLERLERALTAISYAITLDGAVYAPLLERIEQEIVALRTQDDVVARARRNLERFRDRAVLLIEGSQDENAKALELR